jgi:TRAP-type mannitol/chloroaromatic compound transport system substrate-binding protein
VADLQGLKMRIPGLAGEVLKNASAIPVTLTGGEIFSALQSGAIDATEWVGLYNDLAFGFVSGCELLLLFGMARTRYRLRVFNQPTRF